MSSSCSRLGLQRAVGDGVRVQRGAPGYTLGQGWQLNSERRDIPFTKREGVQLVSVAGMEPKRQGQKADGEMPCRWGLVHREGPQPPPKPLTQHVEVARARGRPFRSSHLEDSLPCPNLASGHGQRRTWMAPLLCPLPSLSQTSFPKGTNCPSKHHSCHFALLHY